MSFLHFEYIFIHQALHYELVNVSAGENVVSFCGQRCYTMQVVMQICAAMQSSAKDRMCTPPSRRAFFQTVRFACKFCLYLRSFEVVI